MLPLAEDSCKRVLVLFCVLYTAASFLSLLLTRFMQQRVANRSSPAVKPVDYRDDNLLLRKSLNAANWQIVANKARALHYLKKAPIEPMKTSASFTFGAKRSFGVQRSL